MEGGLGCLLNRRAMTRAACGMTLANTIPRIAPSRSHMISPKATKNYTDEWGFWFDGASRWVGPEPQDPAAGA